MNFRAWGLERQLRSPVGKVRTSGASPACDTRSPAGLAKPQLRARSDDLFGWIARGELKVRIGATFVLSAAADAHRALEGRATTGKVLLLPG